MALISILLGLVFYCSLVSRRLEEAIVTAPIVFTAPGILAFRLVPGVVNWQGNLAVFLPIAEVGLVLLLFIAAFAAGLGVRVCCKEAGKHSVEFPEEWGQLLNLSVFFLFGILVGQSCQDLTLAHFVYACLGLTIVRMLVVAVSLIGTGLSRATVLFLGWFGPRRWASIVLGLVYLEHGTHSAEVPTIRLALMTTVFSSIFAHGFSTIPGINLYSETLSESEIKALPLQPEEATEFLHGWKETNPL
jgi:hypothetical protein